MTVALLGTKMALMNKRMSIEAQNYLIALAVLLFAAAIVIIFQH
jgi:hypothetical protein